MKLIKWDDPRLNIYRKMIEVDRYYEHPIIESNGFIHWQESLELMSIVNKLHARDVHELFKYLGDGKDNFIYKKLKRDLGVSLSTYCHEFYGYEFIVEKQIVINENESEKSFKPLLEKYILDRGI